MKITIKRNSDGVAMKTDKPMKFDDVMEMIMAASLGFMNQFAEQVPENKQQELKEMIYDHYNESASALLQAFMPDKELRPDLTEEAIRKMEDEIMQEVIDKNASRT